jgi:hypothetical protein
MVRVTPIGVRYTFSDNFKASIAHNVEPFIPVPSARRREHRMRLSIDFDLLDFKGWTTQGNAGATP